MAAAGIWLPERIRVPAADERFPSRSGATGEPLLAARGVTFGFDEHVPVLHGVDLSAAAGERIALVGPNGGGKSTLGRLLVGLLRPQQGEVRLARRDPARLPAGELARLAGYVFQRPEQQFLAQRVSDEVMLGLRPGERDEAARLMDRLGLPLGRFGDRSPYRLSGGEQRRLSLACTLVRRPGLLILDEPTFGQDRHGYEALLEIVRDMVDRGTCLIAATHDERFVRDTAERVVVVEDGRVISDHPAIPTLGAAFTAATAPSATPPSASVSA
jgi:energy-coupling factor transport system ATP-binding protein